MTIECRIQIVDSWFFKQALAHDAAGVGQLASVFPPPASTLIGALRTAIGDHLGVDWGVFAKGDCDQKIHRMLGSGEDTGKLFFRGPYMRHTAESDGQVLYPAPAALVVSGAQNLDGLHRLRIGKPIRCDLGEVALPELGANTPDGTKPASGYWIKHIGLNQWLRGDVPPAESLEHESNLIAHENRLGIARDNTSATVVEGLLYETRHVRLKMSDLAICIHADGIPEDVESELKQHTHSIRFGSEGRTAALSWHAVEDSPLEPKKPSGEAVGVMLYLITPALIKDGLLPGFTPVCNEGGHVSHWQGQVNKIELRLISAATHRAQRFGGWDMKAGAPKPLRSFSAAGSVYFCELASNNASLEDVVEQLHGSHIGDMTASGYGELAAGYWLSDEHPASR